MRILGWKRLRKISELIKLIRLWIRALPVKIRHCLITLISLGILRLILVLHVEVGSVHLINDIIMVVDLLELLGVLGNIHLVQIELILLRHCVLRERWLSILVDERHVLRKSLILRILRWSHLLIIYTTPSLSLSIKILWLLRGRRVPLSSCLPKTILLLLSELLKSTKKLLNLLETIKLLGILIHLGLKLFHEAFIVDTMVFLSIRV